MSDSGFADESTTSLSNAKKHEGAEGETRFYAMKKGDDLRQVRVLNSLSGLCFGAKHFWASKDVSLNMCQQRVAVLRMPLCSKSSESWSMAEMQRAGMFVHPEKNQRSELRALLFPIVLLSFFFAFTGGSMG